MLELLISFLHQVVNVLLIWRISHFYSSLLRVDSDFLAPRRFVPSRVRRIPGLGYLDLEGRDPTDVIKPFIIVMLRFK
jgi:hypothetical protein